MSYGEQNEAAPQSREVVERIVADHLPRFGQVLIDAWMAFAIARAQAPAQMAFASASSRGMLLSDFTHEPAHRIFASVSDAWVDDRYGRPWVNLAGGKVHVRFRKLTRELALCRNDSDRAQSLAYHLGDPFLPGMAPATILTAGYVLDLAEQNLKRLELVCHLGPKQVYYSFPIPMDSATASAVAGSSIPRESKTGPTQLSLSPLSPPIIRSAQEVAVRRLTTDRSGGIGVISPHARVPRQGSIGGNGA